MFFIQDIDELKKTFSRIEKSAIRGAHLKIKWYRIQSNVP